MENKPDTASYKIIPVTGGSQYRFYCQLSGMAVCATAAIPAASPQEALSIAWETEGRQHFNRCVKCGRWVCNLMFNVDTSECVACSPWEEAPNFCPYCGAHAPAGFGFCGSCGSKLRYKEDW